MNVLTVDLEYDYETKGTRSLALLPKMLDLFDDNGAKATFFVLGDIAEKHKDVVDQIGKKHEIASHSYTHCNLAKLSTEELENELKRSKEVLGKRCIGFRAPYFIASIDMFELLKKTGYKYDSSISSFFPGRYMHLLSRTKPNKLRNGLVEMPIPNFFPKSIPAGLSYYRLFYPASKMFRIPYMIYMHPCEFINPEGKEISFFVRKMYSRNSGDKAWSIFKNIVEKHKWTTCQDHLRSLDLL